MFRATSVFLLLLSACSFTLDRELDAADVRGTVVFLDGAGQSVAAVGARVEVDASHAHTIADERGRFVLRGIPAGDWAIIVRHTGTDGEERGLRLRVPVSDSSRAPGEGQDLGRVVIGRLGTLAGTIRQAGSAAPGALVLIGVDVAETTGQDGKYEVQRLYPGSYDVSAVREQGSSVFAAPAMRVDIRPSETTTLDLTLEALEGTGRVSGVARLQGQRRHSDITVTLTPRTGAPLATTTNDAGRYEDGVPVGLYSLRAETFGFRRVKVPYLIVRGETQVPSLLLEACEGNVCPDDNEPPPQPAPAPMLCTSSACFELPLPGPAGSKTVAQSTNGTLWLSYGKTLIKRAPNEAWEPALGLPTSIDESSRQDQIGGIQSLATLGEEVYGVGDNGLVVRVGPDGSGFLSPEKRSTGTLYSVHALDNKIYASGEEGDFLVEWPTLTSHSLGPWSYLKDIMTLSNGQSFATDDYSLYEKRGSTFERIDQLVPSDFTPDVLVSTGLHGFVAGTRSGGNSLLLHVTEGSDTTFVQHEIPGLHQPEHLAATGSADLWIAGRNTVINDTAPTLLHFDGERFSSHALGLSSDDYIIGLVAHAQEDVELFTAAGVHLRFDGTRFRATEGHLRSSLFDGAVDSTGAAYARDESGGLFIWDDVAQIWQPTVFPHSEPVLQLHVIAGDVWALCSNSLWRRVNGVWTNQQAPELTGSGEHWAGLWAGGPNDVWLRSEQALYRFDGTNFTSVSTPVPIAYLGGAPGSSPWLVSDSRLFRWSEDEEAFEEAPTPGNDSPRFIGGPSAAHIVLVTQEGAVYEWGQGDWEFKKNDLQDMSSELRHVRLHDNKLLLITYEGTVFTYDLETWEVSNERPTAIPVEDVVQSGSKRWLLGHTLRFEAPGQPPLTRVAMPQTDLMFGHAFGSNGLLYAFGRWGEILRRVDGRWLAVDSWNESSLMAVASAPGGPVHAVTNDGDLLQFFDTTWTPVSAPLQHRSSRGASFTGARFSSLWARDENETFAIADTGLFVYRGETWEEFHSFASVDWVAFITGDANRLFVGGAFSGQNALQVFDGTTWTSEPLEGIALDEAHVSVDPTAGDLYLVDGLTSALYRRKGPSEWETIPIPDRPQDDCPFPSVVFARSSTQIWVAAPAPDSASSPCPPFFGRYDATTQQWHVDQELPSVSIQSFIDDGENVWALGNELTILKLK